ncbi:MAG: VCBS repeat-containing protein [Bacteroidota bacterium]
MRDSKKAVGIFFWLLLNMYFSISCTEKKTTSKIGNNIITSDTEIISNGHKLALTYCQGCHLFPKPQLLDKTSWAKKVLPQMGYHLGINIEAAYKNMSDLEKSMLQLYKIFPEQPLLSKAAWQELQQYYIEEAPEQLISNQVDTTTTNVLNSVKLFQAHFPLKKPGEPPLTTLLHFQQDDELVIGNFQQEIKFYNKNFDSTSHTISTTSSPVGITKQAENYLVLTIGDIFPNNLNIGKLSKLNITVRSTRFSKKIHETLKRPVYFSMGDLDNDADEDIVISNFGYQIGNLIWLEKQQENSYKEHIIKQIPGASKTIITDLNQDGKNDILALIAQGDEGIYAFINTGNGKFTEKNILRFPPVYGSSYFEWVDMNNDGQKDIIYANGDNADYSSILKPYHGIRIFLNKGNLQFEEVDFLPMHGASKTVTYDFDQDGDQDIAAIAFFPDFKNHPERGFIYFENKGNREFVAQYLSAAIDGRWLVMDKGDFDKDGDTDLALGSFINSQIPIPDSLKNKWIHEGKEIMYLENQLL